MSSVTKVPQTVTMPGGELTAEDAKETLRRYGSARLAREAAARFRYGDGFSSSRALALQLCLALIPLVIAFVGLSNTLHTRKVGTVLRRTLLTLTPGTSEDAISEALARPPHPGGGGQLALWLGLLTAVVALTTAMGQVERGANRIYGIQRDRPTREKYGRALLLAGGAGVPSMVGFLLVVSGGALAAAVSRVYDVSVGLVGLVRWPVGVLLMLAAITLLLRTAPRRHQPGWSWLAVGAGVALVLWLAFTGLLVLYLQSSSSFGTVYGPLTGIIALMLWAQLTSVALFLGLAFAAQLEAVRAGVHDGALPDPEAGGGHPPSARSRGHPHTTRAV